METPVISSVISPGMADKEEYLMIQTHENICPSGHGDYSTLARWVGQLNAAQRQACGAYVQDRLRLLDRLLTVVANAKRGD